jgi:hypothetical protein
VSPPSGWRSSATPAASWHRISVSNRRRCRKRPGGAGSSTISRSRRMPRPGLLITWMRDVEHVRKFLPLTGTSERRAGPFRQCQGSALLAVQGAGESVCVGVQDTECAAPEPTLSGNPVRGDPCVLRRVSHGAQMFGLALIWLSRSSEPSFIPRHQPRPAVRGREPTRSVSGGLVMCRAVVSPQCIDRQPPPALAHKETSH